MRLTEQDTNYFSYNIDTDINSKDTDGYDLLDGSSSLGRVIKKVGQLEDIEDELGIDLITLFKALTNGVWLENGNKLEHHKVFLCTCRGTLALGYDWDDKYGLQGWCLETKKYKQHWALTKEELL